jgi:hypothetical protein
MMSAREIRSSPRQTTGQARLQVQRGDFANDALSPRVVMEVMHDR